MACIAARLGVAFLGGGVLPRLWYGYHLCFTPDIWDMLCACTFVEYVQEPRCSFVAKIDLLPIYE